MRSPAVLVSPRNVLIATLIVVAVVVLTLFLWRIGPVLFYLFMGIILAETLRPLVIRLKRWHIPNSVAVALVYLLVAVLLTGLGMVMIPPLVEQFRNLASRLPDYAAQLREIVPRYQQAAVEIGIAEQLDSALTQGAAELARSLSSLSTLPLKVAGNVFSYLSILVITLFWFGATESFDRVILSKVGTKRRELVLALASHISQRVGGWLRGQMLLMLAVGLASLAGLWALGVNFPLPLALWAGLTEFIPFVGPWLGAIPAVIIAAVVSPWLALAVAVLYLVIQQLEGALLVPKVMQQAVGLHPLVVILALLAGGASLGFAGVLIAIPLAGVLQVVIMDLVLPWLEQRMGEPGESVSVPAATSLLEGEEDFASEDELLASRASSPRPRT